MEASHPTEPAALDDIQLIENAREVLDPQAPDDRGPGAICRSLDSPRPIKDA